MEGSIQIQTWQLVAMIVVPFLGSFLGGWIGRERRLTRIESNIETERELRKADNACMHTRCQLINEENGRTFKKLGQNQDKIFEWLQKIDTKVSTLNGIQKGSVAH